ncbi:MAG: hypothetical protein ABJQ71_09480 [Roseibium sp.]
MKMAIVLCVFAVLGIGSALVLHFQDKTNSRYATLTKNSKTISAVVQTEQTASFIIKQPAAAIFSLFTAEDEKKWFPNWDYINLTGRKDMRENDVFMTLPHGHGSNNSIWIVKAYDPDQYLLKLIRVDPVDRLAFYKIKCTELSKTNTRVELSISYLPLSDKGEGFVMDYDEGTHSTIADHWKTLLEDYFAQRG